MVRTIDMTGWCETLNDTTGTLAFALRSKHSGLQVETSSQPGKKWWCLWPGGSWFPCSFSKRPVLKVGCQPAI